MWRLAPARSTKWTPGWFSFPTLKPPQCQLPLTATRPLKQLAQLWCLVLYCSAAFLSTLSLPSPLLPARKPHKSKMDLGCQGH